MDKTSDNNKYYPKPVILFTIGTLGLGGAEKQMVLLIQNLVRLNYKCNLFVLEPFGALEKYLKNLNFKIYYGGYSSAKPLFLKLISLFRAQFRLFRVIRAMKPGVIHAYLPLTNFMGAFTGRILNVPLIITSKRALGNHQERNWGWRFFDMAAFRFSHCVTVNSKAVGEDTLKRDKGNASKIKLIYNGLDFSHFNNDTGFRLKIRKELGIIPDINLIITVANLIPYKGHVELIKAATLVVRRHSNTVFLLVGQDRGIRKNLEKLVQQLGLVDHIIFLDQRHDIPELLAASDISVLPSHEEGFSNVVLESMAAGLPVVATRVGGNPEAIVDGMTGWLVTPQNPEELAYKIVDLLNDPQKARRWGKHGEKRIKENFLVEKMVDRHLQLYNTAGLKNAS
jgi:glycosyltransferase involved in cell wall biosynthesis